MESYTSSSQLHFRLLTLTLSTKLAAPLDANSRKVFTVPLFQTLSLGSSPDGRLRQMSKYSENVAALTRLKALVVTAARLTDDEMQRGKISFRLIHLHFFLPCDLNILYRDRLQILSPPPPVLFTCSTKYSPIPLQPAHRCERSQRAQLQERDKQWKRLLKGAEGGGGGVRRHDEVPGQLPVFLQLLL